MSRGGQGAGSLRECKGRRGMGGRRSEERVRCGHSRLGARNTRCVWEEGGLDPPDPLPL